MDRFMQGYYPVKNIPPLHESGLRRSNYMITRCPAKKARPLVKKKKDQMNKSIPGCLSFHLLVLLSNFLLAPMMGASLLVRISILIGVFFPFA
jgi:hypothetical protein